MSQFHMHPCFQRGVLYQPGTGTRGPQTTYRTALVQLLCLQRLRYRSLGGHFETDCTVGLGEKTCTGSSSFFASNS